MAKVVRIGDTQYKRLKAMAQAHNLSIAQMVSFLVDKIESVKGVEITISDENTGEIIDEGFQIMVEQYPTVAEVERRERNGSKKPTSSKL